GLILSRTSDRTAPGVSRSSPATNPTGASPIPVTATFSEPVTGFGSSDVSVANGTVGTIAGSGTTYTFDVTPTAAGTVTVDVAAGAAVDSATNPSTAATQLSRTYDPSVPSVTLSSAVADPTNATTIPVNVTFSESVSGFTAADIDPTNGTVANFSASGASYAFDLVASATDGLVSADIAAGVAVDSADNG